MDSLSAIAIKLNILPIDSGKFVNACLQIDDRQLGDFDQAMLASSFRLAVLDLQKRMELPSLLAPASVDSERMFDALYKAAWRDDVSSLSQILGRNATAREAVSCIAIPLAVEAFDGEMGFAVATGETERLIWREWKSEAINSRRIDRREYCRNIEGVLTLLS